MKEIFIREGGREEGRAHLGVDPHHGWYFCHYHCHHLHGGIIVVEIVIKLINSCGWGLLNVWLK